MDKSLKHIKVERRGDVFCVHLRRSELQESDILEFADELLKLITADGCRKMVLSLGPGEVDCLYSVFLAKLVMVRRHLTERGGQFKISDASAETIGIFEACRLKQYFDFYPDMDAAVAAFAG
jgi:anti-anti-sigma factor